MEPLWYWYDGKAWKRYDTETARLLQGAWASGSGAAEIVVNGTRYQADLCRLSQRNPVTGFERAMWRGPDPPVCAIDAASASLLHALIAAFTKPGVAAQRQQQQQPPIQKAQQAVAWGIALAEDGLPEHWARLPAGGLVRLDPSCAEAQAVLRRWRNSDCQIRTAVDPARITTVCRIEHQPRWKAYQARKAELQRQFPDGAPQGGLWELHLFHGSKRKSIEGILECEAGIDVGKSVRGLYGKGVYFARASGVSDHYTEADHRGERHILLCRVLVCRVRVGDQSMLNKPDDCDTTVNGDLEIFCKFDNREKYEEYVISYR